MTHEQRLDGGPCAGCLAKLQDAHPFLRDWFKTLVMPNYLAAHISWSYRSKAEQTACIAAGTSKKPWPTSAHNRRVPIDFVRPFDPADERCPNSRPESLALDLFEIINDRALYRTSFYYSLSQDIQNRGLPILWGGKWKKFGDADHFQYQSNP